MITLYGFPKSRSLRISWLLEELGLPWQYHLVNFTQREHRSPEYLAINPAGKIPALTNGDLTLTESGAIALYLAKRYGKGRFLPVAGSDEDALHDFWLCYILTELEQPLWTMGKHKFALPPSQRVEAVLATAQWEFAKALKEVEARIPEQGFLLGDEPTVADILLAHTLSWAAAFKQPLSPVADAFRARLTDRPARARALEKESAALPAD
ncbi:Glutathione S-transferase domain protein [Ferrimonas balearica DSM 9799]|uniref:Glutathione S-transferase domain protein n=1 Tax=Ferrimonas balearica (strain DSM 9799 / CCM 4581 / KCTC 23876 / PAT) TaxID=550540 RepID=E1STD2_FERBD|nr:glutathione S-transferase family protein [Ferrimonas balearica]ADN77166.1 Glutathione S-transferase domain protein [Ferrimonas balearica DSM 9799]